MAGDFSYLTQEQHLALEAEQRQLILELRETVRVLQRRVAELEEQLKGKRGGKPLPGNKPTETPDAAPDAAAEPRAARPHGFARQRLTPTATVDHAAEVCPDCGTALAGGWLHRSREVLELPDTPLEVTSHRYVARQCPRCNRRVLPPPELEGVVAGQQRLGLRLVSYIATLRQDFRLPIASIQALLETQYQLHLSLGGISSVLDGVAAAGAPAVKGFIEQLRSSPVVHADETGWREDGKNGYAWSFSTKDTAVFFRGTRQGAEVDRIVNDTFSGVLVTDFYAAYDHYSGLHQRCWVHLLRDDHDLARLYPDDTVRQAWSRSLHRLFHDACTVTGDDPTRQQAYRVLLQRLLALAKQHAEDATSVVRKLCKRIVRYQDELLVFVRDPTVPFDNNHAERRIRPLAIQRKISGGTRSANGSTTVMTLASLFTTWRLRGLNPLLECQRLLAPHQP